MSSSRVRPHITLDWIGGMAAMAAGLGGMAFYAPANAAPSEQMSGVCRSAMGLEPGQSQYLACLDSLTNTARSVGRAQALDQARGDCRTQGVQPGPDLAECELRQSWTQPRPQLNPVTALRAEHGSYFGETNADHFRREQLACARLGLDPAGGAFDGCVADLRSALFAADNPSQ